MIINAAHEKNYHAGVSQTLADVRNEYWIVQGRSKVSKTIRKCITCIRWDGGPFKTPPFAPYPEYVISGNEPPFTYVGIDYLGPVAIKCDENGLVKNWICLFTCLNIRAVHLELVHNMTSEIFLLCMRRFVARRGTPKLIISDNGSQLKLGSLVATKLWKHVTNDSDVQSYIASAGITWKYTVEYSPWKGGFYERPVRTVKLSLRKKLGTLTLTQYEFVTILNEAEATYRQRIKQRKLVKVTENILIDALNGIS